MLFTREDLLRNAFLPGEAEDFPRMEVVEFPRHSFRKPVQGTPVAHCGSKADFSSSLEFWLWSLSVVEQMAAPQAMVRFAEEALCRPLGAAEFFSIVGSCLAHLKRPPPEFLRPRDSFVGGLTMYSGVVFSQLRVSVLAEFSDDFVALHNRVSL